MYISSQIVETKENPFTEKTFINKSSNLGMREEEERERDIGEKSKTTHMIQWNGIQKKQPMNAGRIRRLEFSLSRKNYTISCKKVRPLLQ